MLTLIVLPQNAVDLSGIAVFRRATDRRRPGLAGLQMPRDQRLLIGWFGIRGIGSIYYLMYAIGQGLLQAPLPN